MEGAWQKMMIDFFEPLYEMKYFSCQNSKIFEKILRKITRVFFSQNWPKNGQQLICIFAPKLYLKAIDPQ